MQTKNMQSDKEELLKLIIDNAYIKEKVKLSSGKESDYYIDARRVTLMAQGAQLCARLIWDMVQEDHIDAIGGPTLGADPLVGAIAFLSLQENKPLKTFIVRKTPKTHGKQQQIEGPSLHKGERVVLIDDVATSGKALRQSVDVLSQLDVKIIKAICIVDRQEGAKEALAKQGCELVSILDIKDIHK